MIENIMLQTWDPVSTDLMHFFSFMFQILMHLSVDPPPVAKIDIWWGDHANAFTAALCSLNLAKHLSVRMSQIDTMLSLPPDAIMLPSNDHLTPQTSWRWLVNLEIYLFVLTSQIMTELSLDPLAIRFPWLPKVSRQPILL